jgi:stage V sporulation protein SpoVS
MNPLRADVVIEDLAKLVLGHLAEIGRPAAKAGNARRRVAGAAARGFDRRSHARIQKLGPVRVDQVHRALDDGVVTVRKASSQRAMISTIALPMQRTSNWLMGASFN